MDVEKLTRRRPVLCLGFCAILLLLCYPATVAALLGGSARLATLFGLLCWAVVVLAYVFTPAASTAPESRRQTGLAFATNSRSPTVTQHRWRGWP